MSIDDFHRSAGPAHPGCPPGPVHIAPQRAVLVVDGVLLLSAELEGCWEVFVYLDVRTAETLRRALVRDVELFGSADVVRERYLRR